MRLSEALELGYLVEPPSNACSFSTCALGTAMAAVGIPFKDRSASTVERLWPWTTREDRGTGKYQYNGTGVHWRIIETIGCMYYGVRQRETTFDELISYVRSVEPPEPEESAAPVESEPIFQLAAESCKS